MTHLKVHIISGIGPDSSGTGQFLSHLLASQENGGKMTVRFHYPLRPAGNRKDMIRRGRLMEAGFDWLRVGASRLWLSAKLRWLATMDDGIWILLHPQTLGFKRSLRYLRAKSGRVLYFGLDESFFCVRSYNHCSGESGACLRCLGGHFEAAAQQECRPFPIDDDAAFEFVREFFALLRQGRVGVLAQNERNAELYRRHGGHKSQVEVVGLWTDDLTRLFEDFPQRASQPYSEGYDIVFHGYYVAAKGADWLLEVARRLPQARFLYPTSLPRHVVGAPLNVTFKPMTWDTGLAAEVAEAKIVCVPSLWSAPIEGALVKSIVVGRATARVGVGSAFGDELPEGLVLNLDPDPVNAARQLGDALEADWAPEAGLHKAWTETFRKENIDVLGRILRAAERLAEKPRPAG